MKKVRALFFSLVIGLCVLSTSPDVYAQDNDRETRTTASDDDDDTDWGWIGLIGLVGLLGLRKNRDHDVDRDRRASTTPGVR